MSINCQHSDMGSAFGTSPKSRSTYCNLEPNYYHCLRGEWHVRRAWPLLHRDSHVGVEDASISRSPCQPASSAPTNCDRVCLDISFFPKQYNHTTRPRLLIYCQPWRR